MVLELSSRLFLSDLCIKTADTFKTFEQCGEAMEYELDKMAEERGNLFHDSDVPPLWPPSAESRVPVHPANAGTTNHSIATIVAPVLIPAFHEQPYDSICAEAIQSGRYNNASYLCYCHETVVPAIIYMPSFQLAQALGHARTLPLAIGQHGSLACILGLRWLERLLHKDNTSHAVLAIIDQTVYPFSRRHWDGYLKADMAMWCRVSSQGGEFEVLSYASRPAYLATDMFHWSSDDYDQAIDGLVQQLESSVKQGEHAQTDLMIVQHVSAKWISQVERIAAQTGISLYQRSEWTEVNGLGSDPFLTLQEAVHTGAMVYGQTALLVFASVDYGIGLIRIRRNFEPACSQVDK
ncbi:hypothetical protein NQ117_18060 [Paenibacillus sp. SC116]|uniref:hypothetical protein n=1 Tax=Paenibacillus sp. SC116 TaxID=2968986 RepID=UPI00215B6136|nr:hypothetical protein [Paenibacillus sp. SC116]MCR8845591.1 hypothetical protein [Paenibacillus sp. SC116]